MTAGAALAVGALGGAGAVARVVLAGWVAGRAPRRFPAGTFAVNLLGAFALGVLAGVALPPSADRAFATGLIGAFTTFSTWMFESERLLAEGRRGLAALYLGASLALGLAAVWAGRALGVAL
ncbi:MAG TPA: CrcB family protein [Solirubrobacteraceae bacterium]